MSGVVVLSQNLLIKTLYLVVFHANIPDRQGFKATRVALLVDQIVYNNRFFAKNLQHIVDCSFIRNMQTVDVNDLLDLVNDMIVLAPSHITC